MFKSFDIDKAFNFFGAHFGTGLADGNDCANAILQTFGLFFARKEISMRDVAILVDGGFYLKRYKKQTDGKQVAKGLLTHCSRNPNLNATFLVFLN
jgi:hypothetical protein